MVKNRTLAVVIITRNEEQMLANALKSVSWADERIVVDDFSQDNTVSIAKKNGARVFRHHQDTRGRQWHYGLSHVRSDWILILAADERIPLKLAKEIQSVITDPKYDAYNIYFHQFFLGKPLRPTLSGGHPRLFKNGTGFFSPTSAHEGPFVNCPTGQLSTPIQHFSYQSVFQVMQKFNQYSSEEAQELYTKGFRHHLVRLFAAPITMFWQRQIKDHDFESGLRGIVLSLLFSYYVFLKWVKVWEIEYGKKS